MTMEEAQKLQQEAQRKAMGINQQYMTQVQQKMDVALAEIAKEKKLDVVVDNEGLQKTVLLGGIDVTDEVIQKLQ
jgi:outer membrane protein